MIQNVAILHAKSQNFIRINYKIDISGIAFRRGLGAALCVSPVPGQRRCRLHGRACTKPPPPARAGPPRQSPRTSRTRQGPPPATPHSDERAHASRSPGPVCPRNGPCIRRFVNWCRFASSIQEAETRRSQKRDSHQRTASTTEGRGGIKPVLGLRPTPGRTRKAHGRRSQNA